MRYLVCDIVLDAEGGRIARVAKTTNGVHDYAGVKGTLRASNVNGKTWCLVKVSATDWTAIDDDTNMFSFFGNRLDSQTLAQIKNFLKTTLVGDLTTQQKTNAQNKLTTLGVDTTGITNATTLFEVLRRVLVAINPQADMESF